MRIKREKNILRRNISENFPGVLENNGLQYMTVIFEPGLELVLILAGKYGIPDISTVPLCIFYILQRLTNRMLFEQVWGFIGEIFGNMF